MIILGILGGLALLLLLLMSYDLFGKLRVRFVLDKADYDKPSGISFQWWQKDSHGVGSASGNTLFKLMWRSIDGN